ncbi:hypothetical protein FH972_021021 [Carpinus fangiana]|uniref:Uncharacterized protein n=1 Tax=Carpinus fangiana TaxID=176857 RepID=A0A5N6KN49_9ROSI|nr:hypothetical protein FH972_021021 [Carpinus fangiana]
MAPSSRLSCSKGDFSVERGTRKPNRRENAVGAKMADRGFARWVSAEALVRLGLDCQHALVDRYKIGLTSRFSLSERVARSPVNGRTGDVLPLSSSKLGVGQRQAGALTWCWRWSWAARDTRVHAGVSPSLGSWTATRRLCQTWLDLAEGQAVVETDSIAVEMDDLEPEGVSVHW